MGSGRFASPFQARPYQLPAQCKATEASPHGPEGLSLPWGAHRLEVVETQGQETEVAIGTHCHFRNPTLFRTIRHCLRYRAQERLHVEYEIEQQRLMRLDEVKRVTGLSRTLIYEMMPTGDFPERVRLHKRSVGWRACEVLDWLKSRPEAG